MELQAAIDNIYKVFARYPLNPNMDGSPMYDKLPEWNRQLARKPLRVLTEDDLVVFYFKVLTTWGDLPDFKHFLPRIFELLTKFPMGWEVWVALDKLNYGHWHTWPEREQAAVRAYLLPLWDMVLTTPNEWADTCCQDYFGAIANVYSDLPELLHRWEQAPLPGLLRLGVFVRNTFEHMRKKQSLSAFDKRLDLAPAVLAWLVTDTVVARLHEAFFAASDPYLAECASQAVQLIEQERARQLRN